MNPQAPIVPPESSEVFPTPQTPPVSPNQVTNQLTNKPSRDPHWITILAMAIFVVLSLGVVAFLYYQNQALKSMLASLQTPVPAASPTPTATADPTADWKTYTNDKLLVSLRYPSENGLQIFTYPTNNLDISINKGQYDPLFFEVIRLPNLNLQNWYPKAYSATKQDQTLPPELRNGTRIDGLDSYTADFNIMGAGKIIFIFVQKGKDLYEIHMPTTGNEVQNLILSTFKFTEATPSTSPSPSTVSSTTTTYAKEGESCGGLAGPAGNAQCAPGLTCQHQDPNNYNIGACAK